MLPRPVRADLERHLESPHGAFALRPRRQEQAVAQAEEGRQRNEECNCIIAERMHEPLVSAEAWAAAQKAVAKRKRRRQGQDGQPLASRQLDALRPL